MADSVLLAMSELCELYVHTGRIDWVLPRIRGKTDLEFFDFVGAEGPSLAA